MKDKVKKLIKFQPNHYKDIEGKLEKLAEKGLFLEKCGSLFWTFRKGEPRKLRYMITFTHLVAIFDSDNTNNQETYVDYAEAVGWSMVANWNQIQIFCSDAENPIPLKMDEKEKFDNIKGTINSGFVPFMISTFTFFGINLSTHIESFQRDQASFFVNKIEPVATAMDVVLILYSMYLLIDYFVWYKRSKRAVVSGGECIGHSSIASRRLESVTTWLITGSLVFCLIALIGK